jgi:hypothetical protein
VERHIDKLAHVTLCGAESQVIEQRHETEIHVQLLMTMEQRKTGIVGHEVDFINLIAAQHDDVFQDTRRGSFGEIRELEAVPVKMDGMDVVTGVAHAQTIAFTRP